MSGDHIAVMTIADGRLLTVDTTRTTPAADGSYILQLAGRMHWVRDPSAIRRHARWPVTVVGRVILVLTPT